MKVRIISSSPAQTKRIAVRLAKKIAKKRTARAAVIALEGELGAGKTTFVQGFARGLGIKQKVRSPTFLLVKNYPLSTSHHSLLYHIDCYRIKNYRELIPLEIKSIFRDRGNIVLIEWPERIEPLLPTGCTIVHIDHIDKTKRNITIRK